MPTVSNVTTGKPMATGAIYRAALGTSAPTSVDASLSSFAELGYASEDGLENNNSPSTDTAKAWGGDIVYCYTTEKEDTFHFTLIEAVDTDVLKATYNDSNITGALDTGITVKANANEGDENVWVFDILMRDGVAKRIVVPDGKVSEVGAITYKDDELVGYELTITALPDSSGNTHYEYIKKVSGATGATGATH